MDIALATEARAMYANLLTDEDREKLAGLHHPDELVAFLGRSAAWRPVSASLPPIGATDAQFSEALSRCVYEDYERLYRFANDASKEFLLFMSYEAELRAILSALRRLSDKSLAEEIRLPSQAARLLRGVDIERLKKAATFQELTEAVRGSMYYPVLSAMELDPKTGMPDISAAALQLSAHYYHALDRHLRHGYRGPSRQELAKTVSFRTDMLNISFLLRLRRFGTPAERAMKLLLPLHGALSPEAERRILQAGSDEEAMAEIRASRVGRWLAGVEGGSPEQRMRAAETAYYRKVMHGPPTLCVVDAFLTLKENEADMLRRVFIALQYGLSPANYIL